MADWDNCDLDTAHGRRSWPLMTRESLLGCMSANVEGFNPSIKVCSGTLGPRGFQQGIYLAF